MKRFGSLEAYRAYEQHKTLLMGLAMGLTDDRDEGLLLVKRTLERLLGHMAAGDMTSVEVDESLVRQVFGELAAGKGISGDLSPMTEGDTAALDAWFEGCLKSVSSGSAAKKRKRFPRHSLRVVGIVTAIVVALTSAALSSEVVRGSINGFFLERNGEYTRLKLQGSSPSAGEVLSEDQYIAYDLSYLPEGYRLEEEIEMFHGRILTYKKGDERLHFDHDKVGENGSISMSIDTENAYTESLLIEGQSALYVSKDYSDETNVQQLVWQGTDGTVFSLYATNMTRDMFIKMAENVKRSGIRTRVHQETIGEEVSDLTNISEGDRIDLEEGFRLYDLSFIPDGFELTGLRVIERNRTLIYGAGDSWVAFDYDTLDLDQYFYMEDPDIEYMTVKDLPAVYVERERDSDMIRHLVWEDGQGVVLSLYSANMDFSLLMTLAEGIMPNGQQYKLLPDVYGGDTLEDMTETAVSVEIDPDQGRPFDYGSELAFYKRDEASSANDSPLEVVLSLLDEWNRGGKEGIEAVDLYRISYELDTDCKWDLLEDAERDLRPENIAIVCARFDITYDSDDSQRTSGVTDRRFVLIREDDLSPWVLQE